MNALTTGLRTAALVVLTSAIVVAVLLISADNVKAQYTGNENHVISLSDAVKYIQNYKTNPSIPTIKGGYFGRNIFEKILAQTGCVGIRYYYAKLDNDTPTLVLVGVDNSGHDMEQGVIGEVIYPCPPNCGASSQLNK